MVWITLKTHLFLKIDCDLLSATKKIGKSQFLRVVMHRRDGNPALNIPIVGVSNIRLGDVSRAIPAIAV